MRLIFGLAGFPSRRRCQQKSYTQKYRDRLTLTDDHTKALKEIFEEFAKYM